MAKENVYDMLEALAGFETRSQIVACITAKETKSLSVVTKVWATIAPDTWYEVALRNKSRNIELVEEFKNLQDAVERYVRLSD